MTAPRPREPLPDALRALALIGVLVVNGIGYRDAPYARLLGDVQPPDSLLAQAVTFVVAAFVQGKAYPVLALLFGMGLALAARGRPFGDALLAADRRNARLLMLGIAHGLFLYYGDILTLYAVCGFWVARHLREPWRRFLPRLRRAVGVALLAIAAAVALALAPVAAAVGPAASLGSVDGYRAFLLLNAGTYAVGQVFGLLLALPLVRLCMLGGIAAVRLRLLTHARWRGALQRALRRWAAPLLLANLAYAASYVMSPGAAGASRALESAAPLWALPLAALYLAAAAPVWQGRARAALHALVPLGRHTLSVYVGASALMLILFSGAGLGWQPGTAGAAAAALALWAAVALASRCLPGRWPLEAWMARR